RSLEQTNIKGGSYVQVGVNTPWFFSLAISLANLLPSHGIQNCLGSWLWLM
ncbi:hypothetical protein PIB30_062817, partial [Stylosanthes scabra]|nr:hypothetical protein [Stylosanthes scabra]